MRLAALLHRLSQGHLASAELPEIIELGDVGLALDEMYQQSAADLRERAALILMEPGGNIRLSSVTSGVEYQTMLEPDEQTGTAVGLIHTHPPHGGARGVAFSAQDIVTMINDGDLLALLQSGRNLVALVRTDETAIAVTGTDVKTRMNELTQQALFQSSSRQEALLRANLSLCREYGLAFYAGYAPGPIWKVLMS